MGQNNKNTKLTKLANLAVSASFHCTVDFNNCCLWVWCVVGGGCCWRLGVRARNLALAIDGVYTSSHVVAIAFPLLIGCVLHSHSSGLHIGVPVREFLLRTLIASLVVGARHGGRPLGKFRGGKLEVGFSM